MHLFEFSPPAAFALLIIAVSAAAGDIKNYRIPDRLILTGVILRGADILAGAAFGYISNPDCLTSYILHIFLRSCIITFPILTVTYITENIFKRKMLGGGDIKLIFMLSLFFDLETDLTAMFAACIFGLIQCIGSNNYFGSGTFPGSQVSLGSCVSLGSQVSSGSCVSQVAHARREPVAFAVSITAGWMAVFCSHVTIAFL